MGLARGRGRGRGGIMKAKSRGSPMKPPPLLGRFAPPPMRMGLRPRELPVPPFPRMRPPHPGMRPPPPHARPPLLGPPHPPVPPPFHPLPLRGHLPPPPMPPRPPLPPPSLLRARGHRVPFPPPMQGMRPPGFRPPVPPMSGRRGALPFRGGKRKPRPKKTELAEDDVNKPWVTEAMKSEIHKKHQLFQKAKQSNDSKDWEEFKEQRNRVTTMIREAKLEYIGSHPEEAEEDESYWESADEEEFYCEACDREFKSAELLAAHKAEHETCGRDGCTFTAHPKLVLKHIEAQHKTGLYKRIGDLSTPDAIAAWIAERKKNFPTKENVERKVLQKDAREKRGERLSDDGNRLNRGSCSSRNKESDRGRRRGGRKRQRNEKYNAAVPKFLEEEGDVTQRRSIEARRGGQRNEKYKPAVPKFLEEEEEDTRKGSIEAFPGTAAFYSDVCSDHEGDAAVQEAISDEEWDTRETSSVATVGFCNALSSLMGQYASDQSASEDESPPSTVPVQPPSIKGPEEKVVCEAENYVPQVIVDGEDEAPEEKMVCEAENCIPREQPESNEAPEEVPILYKNEEPPPSEKQEPQQRETRKRKRHHRTRKTTENAENKPPSQPVIQRRPPLSHPQRKRPPTLLEKLLSKEIRHERNVILQCVRFVVQNNYFGIGQPSVTSTEKCRRLNVLKECIHYVCENRFFDDVTVCVS